MMDFQQNACLATTPAKHVLTAHSVILPAHQSTTARIQPVHSSAVAILSSMTMELTRCAQHAYTCAAHVRM